MFRRIMPFTLAALFVIPLGSHAEDYDDAKTQTSRNQQQVNDLNQAYRRAVNQFGANSEQAKQAKNRLDEARHPTRSQQMQSDPEGPRGATPQKVTPPSQP